MCRRLSCGLLAAALLLLAGCQGASEKAKDAPFRLETARQAQGADQRIRFLVIHYTVKTPNWVISTR
ncbi:hypothetical protein A8A01_09060 [Ewingella americana]|nr:hypothetical protein A8A01_09060 [Ewingella americana]